MILMSMYLIYRPICLSSKFYFQGGRPSDIDYSYSPDQHTRVHYTRNPSFLDKVGNSICAAVFGFFIVVGAFPLLYWNEVNFTWSFFSQGSILTTLVDF